MGDAPPASAALGLKGVLCAGNIVHDLIVHPVDRVIWGTSSWVESLESRLGGNGANTAYALAVLGIPVRLLSTVGDDQAGKDLVRRLRDAGVDVRRIKRSPLSTAASIVLVNSRGERCFIHHPGAIAEAFADPMDFSSGAIEGVSHFHLANLFALPQLRGRVPEVIEAATKAGLTTSLDTGWDSLGAWLTDLGDCLKMLDLLFVNEAEATKLTGEKRPLRAVAGLKDAGARLVVLKSAERGCLVTDRHRQIRVPAFRVKAVDTTGAGDCFAAGFLAALSRGCSIEESGRMANAVAALSVQRFGATAGLRSWGETVAWTRTARISMPR